jgi:hypothetical protein
LTLTLTLTFGPPLWSSGQSSWLQIGDVLCFLWGTNWIYVCYVCFFLFWIPFLFASCSNTLSK